MVAQRQYVVLWESSSRHAVLDVAVEGAAVTLRAAGGVVRGASTVAMPLVDVVLRPPMLRPSLHPATWLQGLARRGELHRLQAQSEVERILDQLVPVVLGAVLDRVDLNQLVRQRVDVDALVAAVDISAVLDRLDLPALAEQVIADVDLPEIIRASTGSVTSETVRGVRMRSISGDDAVARVAGRFRLRRRAPRPAVATEPS